MISHVLDALAPQVERIVINANRNLDEYRAFGLPVAKRFSYNLFLHNGFKIFIYLRQGQLLQML